MNWKHLLIIWLKHLFKSVRRVEQSSSISGDSFIKLFGEYMSKCFLFCSPVLYSGNDQLYGFVVADKLGDLEKVLRDFDSNQYGWEVGPFTRYYLRALDTMPCQRTISLIGMKASCFLGLGFSTVQLFMSDCFYPPC